MDNISEKRLKVAIELATKEGQSFESLPEVMKNAFLHNADCAIADRAGKVLSKTGKVMEVYTCSVCKDKGWIDEKPCYECNPIGLKKEEIYPEPEPEDFKYGHHFDFSSEELINPKLTVTLRPEPENEVVLPLEVIGRAVSLSTLSKTSSTSVSEVKKDDSISGTGPDNQPTGSGDTGEPEKPKKPKAKKKARKKSQ